MSFYICSNCGYGSGSWMGKCPDCNQWNTFVRQADPKDDKKSRTTEKAVLTPLKKIRSLRKDKISTGMFEFDRVLGGGFVPGEIILLTGEPGIGKSTLLLQSLHKLNTVYISGEESAEQVKDRADRLDVDFEKFYFSDNLQVEGIIDAVTGMEEKPQVVVIDSIQTVYSRDAEGTQGSVGQIKESGIKLTKMAKENHIAVIIIGHVTKEGDIAGPKTLEHLVDCVLAFEGDKLSDYRILRAAKNRFGSTDEIGIFAMKETGLAEVNNPLAFIDGNGISSVGKAVVGVSEGKRPLFYEIQTLAVPTVLAVPRRVVKGLDYNKVQLLLAVIRKFLNLSLDSFDIYVNVVGGVNIKSTSADLGVVASIISTIKNIPIDAKTVFVGEVGLLGEIRNGYGQEKIVSESKRLKFKTIVTNNNLKNVKGLSIVLTDK